jgi:hypothetical protein
MLPQRETGWAAVSTIPAGESRSVEGGRPGTRRWRDGLKEPGRTDWVQESGAGSCGREGRLGVGEGEDGAAVAGGSRQEIDDLVDTGFAVCCGGGAVFGLLGRSI